MRGKSMKVYCEDCKHYYLLKKVDECRFFTHRVVSVTKGKKENPIHKPWTVTLYELVFYNPLKQNKKNNCEFFTKKEPPKSTIDKLVEKLNNFLYKSYYE